jgi:hypothetical protein
MNVQDSVDEIVPVLTAKETESMIVGLHGGDAAAIDGNIGHISRRLSAVDNCCTANDKIMHGRSSHRNDWRPRSPSSAIILGCQNTPRKCHVCMQTIRK